MIRDRLNIGSILRPFLKTGVSRRIRWYIGKIVDVVWGPYFVWPRIYRLGRRRLDNNTPSDLHLFQTTGKPHRNILLIYYTPFQHYSRGSWSPVARSSTNKWFRPCNKNRPFPELDRRPYAEIRFKLRPQALETLVKFHLSVYIFPFIVLKVTIYVYVHSISSCLLFLVYFFQCP